MQIVKTVTAIVAIVLLLPFASLAQPTPPAAAGSGTAACPADGPEREST
jgi:hypothetical protein